MSPGPTGPRVLAASTVVTLLALAGCSASGDDLTPDPSPAAPASPDRSSSATSAPTPSESPATTPSPDEKEDEVEPPPFRGSVEPIRGSVLARMTDPRTGSHRDGCPRTLDDLRYLRMSYVDDRGRVQQGEMVVAAAYAQDVLGVFETLYDARWPIASMRLVDDFGGDDDASMAANNTSAYNCRTVAGTDRWSNHSYGAAIDINPVQNPYVQATSIDPPAGRPWADVQRSRGVRADPGVIVEGDVVVRAFDRIGWEWGGRWSSAKDYQHFSADGG